MPRVSVFVMTTAAVLALATGSAVGQPSPGEGDVVPRIEPDWRRPPTLPVTPPPDAKRPDMRDDRSLLPMDVHARWRASKLIGMRVDDRDGVETAEVADLLIDGRGVVVGVLLSVASQLGMGERLGAVELTSLHDTGGALVTQATREALQTAPVWSPRR